ncbi:hypothetical protein D3C71_2014740 [compost metagenome]
MEIAELEKQDVQDQFSDFKLDGDIVYIDKRRTHANIPLCLNATPGRRHWSLSLITKSSLHRYNYSELGLVCNPAWEFT